MALEKFLFVGMFCSEPHAHTASTISRTETEASRAWGTHVSVLNSVCKHGHFPANVNCRGPDSKRWSSKLLSCLRLRSNRLPHESFIHCNAEPSTLHQIIYKRLNKPVKCILKFRGRSTSRPAPFGHSTGSGTTEVATPEHHSKCTKT